MYTFNYNSDAFLSCWNNMKKPTNVQITFYLKCWETSSLQFIL